MFEQNASAVNFSKAGRSRMFAHVLLLSAEWVDTLPYDFRDAEMRRRSGRSRWNFFRLEELLGLCMVDKSSQKQTQELTNNLRNTLNKLDRYEKALLNLRHDPKDALQPTTEILVRPWKEAEWQSGLMLVSDKAPIVAQQLTHVELERFNMVGADEILDALAHDDIASIGKTRVSVSFLGKEFSPLP